MKARVCDHPAKVDIVDAKIPQKIGRDRPNAYPVVFLTMNDYKIINAEKTVAQIFLKRRAMKFVFYLTRNLASLQHLVWFYGVAATVAVISFDSELPLVSVLPAYLWSIMNIGLQISTIDPVIFVDNLFSFQFIYLLCNLFGHSISFGLSVGLVGAWWVLILFEYMSYFLALLSDSYPMSFKRFEAMSSLSFNQYQERNVTLTSCMKQSVKSEKIAQEGDSQDQIKQSLDKEMILLSGDSLEETYRTVYTPEEGPTKGISTLKSEKKKTTRLKMYTQVLALATGVIIQLCIYILVQLDVFDNLQKEIITIYWVKWSLGEILTFTTIIVMTFTLKGTVKFTLHPDQPACYKRGLLRIPLVPQWLDFIRKKAHEHESNKDIALTSSENKLELNHFVRLEDLKGNKLSNFTRSHIKLCMADLQHHRLVAVFPLKIEHTLNPNDSIFHKIIHSPIVLSKKGLYKIIRRFCFSCWIASFIITPFCFTFKIFALELIYLILSIFGLIDLTLFLLRIPLKVYQAVLSNFEIAFLVTNMFSLALSLADYFNWSGIRTYSGCLILLGSMIRTVFYDSIEFDWKRIEKNISKILESKNIEKFTFTQSILAVLYDYYVKKGIIKPSPEGNPFDKTYDHSTKSPPSSFYMNKYERKLYSELIGYNPLIYYLVALSACTANYICLIGGYYYDVNDRDIRIFIFTSQNSSVLKGSVFNIVIFTLKALYTSLINPMISTSITSTYYRTPLVPSFMRTLAQSQQLSQDENKTSPSPPQTTIIHQSPLYNISPSPHSQILNHLQSDDQLQDFSSTPIESPEPSNFHHPLSVEDRQGGGHEV
eukprot:TRINITY_DN4732_c0_g1_i1.p1 TRINITY_DN4732_c0_g1~~TRINITY_DN4732_c0_g1_i1.p1  ORF type:complete len:824 (+),score=102.50 TRINITY_DN4732_c0_g1_i1:61-2532(+)